MPVFRKCSVCQHKVLEGTLCKCEIENKKKSYKEYKQRIRQNENEAKLIDFYNSCEWHKLRTSVSLHQFGLDLIEWHKGNIVKADTYHHIYEVRECWDKRLDVNNIIGVSAMNHNRIHAMMDKGLREKKELQEELRRLLKEFELDYY